MLTPKREYLVQVVKNFEILHNPVGNVKLPHNLLLILKIQLMIARGFPWRPLEQLLLYILFPNTFSSFYFPPFFFFFSLFISMFSYFVFLFHVIVKTSKMRIVICSPNLKFRDGMWSIEARVLKCPRAVFEGWHEGQSRFLVSFELEWDLHGEQMGFDWILTVLELLRGTNEIRCYIDLKLRNHSLEVWVLSIGNVSACEFVSTWWNYF